MQVVHAPPSICPMADPATGAAAAIIVTPDRRFLLQLRDAKPDIWFPDSWSLFGGGIETGETPAQAIVRELAEEIELVPRQIFYFTQIAWDFAAWNLGIKVRYAFEVPVTVAEIEQLKLHEGQAMRLFTADEVLSEKRLTPYDSLALRLFIEETPVGLAKRLR